MGKGDKKTKRGKIVIGSYGVRRAKKRKTFKVKPKVSGGILSEKKPAIIEPVLKTVIEEQPLMAIQEPIKEIKVSEEQAVKKTPAKKTPAEKTPAKKTAAKKTPEEKTEESAETKPKTSKTKKKTASTD